MSAPSRRADERGIVLVWFALALTVMLVASAFAVDVGAWYKRSQDLQKAADSAALAGVTYLPAITPALLTSAQNAAFASLTSNGINYGFANGTAVPGGDPNISVTVAVVPNQPRQLQVTVADAKVSQYFSQLAFSGMHETRTAIAEFLPSVPLGSPLNVIGTGDLAAAAGTTSHNLFAAVTGWCTPKEGGDRFLSRYDATFLGGNSWNCPTPYTTPASPGVVNSEYDTFGHFYDYVVDIPAGRSTPVDIWAYDPYYMPFYYLTGNSTKQDCTGPDQGYTTASYSITTHFDVIAPDGRTVVQNNTFASTEGGYTVASPHGDPTTCKVWKLLSPAAGISSPGKYHVRVYTNAGEANSFGVNSFSLTAVDHGTSQLTICTQAPISGFTQSATCPSVYGKDAIAVYATADRTGGSGQGGDFYLAQIGAAHKGAQMTINLWDPGEGGQYIAVLDNTGAKMPFTYTVSPCSSSCSGSVTSASNGLDVSGTGTPPSGYQGTGTYNDKLLTLTVNIPANYDTYAATNGGWWKILYNITTGSTAVHDMTTWTVKVGGNPAHLIKSG